MLVPERRLAAQELRVMQVEMVPQAQRVTQVRLETRVLAQLLVALAALRLPLGQIKMALQVPLGT
jgi:hypothetical protein